MDIDDEPERHIVVFDCNIYLDAAQVLGQPFRWESFEETAK